MLLSSILVENICAFAFGSMPCLFTFVVGDAWRVRDMREKMRSSNGHERP